MGPDCARAPLQRQFSVGSIGCGCNRRLTPNSHLSRRAKLSHWSARARGAVPGTGRVARRGARHAAPDMARDAGHGARHQTWRGTPDAACGTGRGVRHQSWRGAPDMSRSAGDPDTRSGESVRCGNRDLVLRPPRRVRIGTLRNTAAALERRAVSAPVPPRPSSPPSAPGQRCSGSPFPTALYKRPALLPQRCIALR
jgi:hypothetical protein